MRPYRPTTRHPLITASPGNVLVAGETFTYGGFTVNEGDAYQVVSVDGSQVTVKGADDEQYTISLPSLPPTVTVHSATILRSDTATVQGVFVELRDVQQVINDFAARYAGFHPSVRQVADDLYAAIAQRV